MEITVIPKVTAIKGIDKKISLTTGDTLTLKPELEPEEFADEPAGVTEATIVQITDKYYVIYDDAGYFLRTYEKGSADEQLIITTKQVNGEE